MDAPRQLRDSQSRSSSRGGSLDDLRRTNLSTVLDLVHVNGSASRAELTQATGLNRSTVATIVSELERLGLVEVAEPRDTKRIGRPSSVVTPSHRHVAVTVNPELDAVTIGIVALGGAVLRTVRCENETAPTGRGVVNLVSAVLAGMLPELDGAHRVVGIGLAVPGLVRRGDGLVTIAPHLGWRDEPITESIAEATGLPAAAANDASCGAVAEALFGAGRGFDDLVYLNGGASGIGGGVIAGGAPMGGKSGFSGELGHTLVNSGGTLCHCGSIGCLETEVVRSALLSAVGLSDGDEALLEDRLVAAYPVDAAVREVVDRQVRFLGIALRNIVNAFNPGCVILGGFLAILCRMEGEALVAAVRASSLPGPATDVVVVPSELGRDNLLIGAGELAFRAVMDDPASAATRIHVPIPE